MSRQLPLSDELADTVEVSLWTDEAYEAISRLASVRWEFTSEDIIEAVGVAVRDLRLLGPVLLQAERELIVAQTGRFTRAARPSRHGGPLRIWRSLILGTVPTRTNNEAPAVAEASPADQEPDNHERSRSHG